MSRAKKMFREGVRVRTWVEIRIEDVTGNAKRRNIKAVPLTKKIMNSRRKIMQCLIFHGWDNTVSVNTSVRAKERLWATSP